MRTVSEGDQRSPDCFAISPTSSIQAIVDKNLESSNLTEHLEEGDYFIASFGDIAIRCQYINGKARLVPKKEEKEAEGVRRGCPTDPGLLCNLTSKLEPIPPLPQRVIADYLEAQKDIIFILALILVGYVFSSLYA